MVVSAPLLDRTRKVVDLDRALGVDGDGLPELLGRRARDEAGSHGHAQDSGKQGSHQPLGEGRHG
jgi:hypothetical protein